MGSRYTAMLISLAAAMTSQAAAWAQWADTAAAPPPAEPGAQSAPTAAPAPPAPPAPPNIQQLLNAASVKFDPSRESPQGYYQRMQALQQQFKAYEQMEEQARLDPPIKRLAPGTLLPGMSAYQSDHPFAGDPNDKGFFNGITPEQAAAGLRMKLKNKVDVNRSPEWAKQRPQLPADIDSQHNGKEDSMGFIN